MLKTPGGRTIPALFELTARGLTIGYDDAPTRHKLPGRTCLADQSGQTMPRRRVIKSLIFLRFANWHGFCSVNGELPTWGGWRLGD